MSGDDGTEATPAERSALADRSTPADRSAGSRIAVISKAATVLDALRGHPDGATPSALSAEIGLNRSTTFRLLSSLEHAGLVDRDAPTGRYRLGLRLLVLGDAVRQHLDLPRLSAPTMRELRDTVRQTVYLSVRDGWGAICLERLPGPDVDVLAWKVGQRLPFHIGAGPRAFLAALPDDELARYLDGDTDRSTRNGTLTAADIRSVIAQTRARGWSLNSEDITAGVASMGMVVRRHPGESPMCALSIAGLRDNFEGERLERLAASLQAATASLGAVLAGGPTR